MEAIKTWSQQPSALLTVVFALAVFGTIVVARVQPAPTALHRTASVHRPRSEPGSVECIAPTTDAPFGRLIVSRHGRQVLDCNIAVADIPSHHGYRHYYHHELIDIRGLALRSAVDACRHSNSFESLRRGLADLGLYGLLDAFITDDESQLQQRISLLSSLPALITAISTTETQETEPQMIDELEINHFLTSSGRDFDDPMSVTTDADFEASQTQNQEPSQDLRSLLYHIAEEDAKSKAYVHRGVHCEQCGETIQGIRWHCLQCYDMDLCSACETSDRHNRSHIFAKIKIPIPFLCNALDRPLENIYPGSSNIAACRPLKSGDNKILAERYDSTEPQIDALFEQFSCLASQEWPEDELSGQIAMDEHAFYRALSNKRWKTRASARFLYDRMFSFYDTDRNGLIGFEEFVSGLTYLRGAHRFDPLDRVLQGFDVDRDGYIDRGDILRMLEAKFAVQRELIDEMIECQELVQIRNNDAKDALESRQPISAILTEASLPNREQREIRGKATNVHGDLVPNVGTDTILSNDKPWHEQANVQTGNLDNDINSDMDDAFFDMLNGDLGGANSISPLSVPDVRNDKHDHADRMFDQGILWQMTRDGHNELLDGLFLEKERLDSNAIASRPQRQKHQLEIRAELSRRLELQDISIEASNDDPLLATARDAVLRALSSHDVEVGQKSHTRCSSAASARIRSEDPDWQQPGEASVENLPRDSRVTRDDDKEHLSSSSEVGLVLDDTKVDMNGDKSSLRSNLLTASNTEQNAPDTTSTQDHIRELATLELAAYQVWQRGGPGRLSFKEIMSTAYSDQHLQGLLRSWLEWASF